MSKRAHDELQDVSSDSDIDVSSSEDEEMVEEGEDPGTINVDFDFFNLNPDIDFMTVKNLLRQLFQQDSVDFPLSQLADLLLSQTEVGTTIKTDGRDGDPFSIITVTNMTKNLENPGIQTLKKYFVEKTAEIVSFNALLQQLLSKDSKESLALIFSERLINMPAETAPPLYRMLVEEMGKTGSNYDYFLIPSRVYQIVDSQVDKELEEEEGRAKKAKKGGKTGPEIEYYHYEDEQLEKYSMHHAYFDYTKKGMEPDARRVFNDYAVVPKLSLILISRTGLEKATKEMLEVYAPQQQQQQQQ